MKKILTTAIIFMSFSIAGQAAIIFDITSSLTAINATQLGRLSRNDLAQDWSGSEAFPGVINTTTTYNYTTYIINPGAFSFIQIDMDSLSANTFASAYLNAYLPDSAGTPNFGFNTNWLGDDGSSGNSFGTDPLFFQVIVPVGQELVVVINNSGAAGLGDGDPFHLTVEGFYDSNFNDTVNPVPEPTTFAMLGGGLAFAGLAARLRKSGSRV